MTQAVAIAVAVCMFERISILDTLGSLAAIEAPPGVRLRIVIADNNVVPISRHIVEQEAARLGLEVHYVHAPSCNISIARNACLDAADAQWLAFVDDDEVMSPDWLRNVWAQTAEADAVFGPVRAIYDRCPAWMACGDFHSTGIGPRDRPDKGYCGNVLFRLSPVRAGGLRFDPALGRIGGEDTDFFRRFYRFGARFAFAPAAAVYEPVPAERASLGWLARRRFRTGQIHAVLTVACRGERARLAALALVKCLLSAVAAILWAPVRTRSAGFALRLSFHAGVVAALCGHAPLREYGATGLS